MVIMMAVVMMVERKYSVSHSVYDSRFSYPAHTVEIK